MIKLINEYLPRINFLLSIVLVILIGTVGFVLFKSKKESQEVANQLREMEKQDSKIVIVSKDGVFQVLEGKEVSIESLSPLVIKYKDDVFRQDGTFYLYTKDNVIYIFSMNDKSIIGAKKR